MKKNQDEITALREALRRTEAKLESVCSELDDLCSALESVLPEYVFDDGTDEPASLVERAEYTVDELRRCHLRAARDSAALIAADALAAAILDAERGRPWTHVITALDAYREARGTIGTASQQNRCV